MTLDELNHLPPAARAEELRKCCGASAWVAGLNEVFPVTDVETLLDQADTIWNQLSEADWKEAFTHHPKIGGNVAALREKFASTSAWAEGEQAGVRDTSEAVLQALSDGNETYERKFGNIFIVFATGKTAEQMLALLEARLHNTPEDEIKLAAAEQSKITRIRLEKLLSPTA
ncbi:2-oxo-4-hydroxy-4-carboxy-5-ureidoimidazoline decarboxylase [Hymenobacter daecheongensis DSM 21074]|uniref:2-oxo-4-hydroxy-4-carboxy-5-ureidoimidazoline decarboxylase n=1 Tax=Hymenobacter daecheongensis DSM 21074 TaxID=1121955 RepID=A0A1M6KNB0_9BACT|nr:2-oxo-4-hydroxy-4-carboxy-5-ureidoimidazoline decarboxylase [Hymenobacter daecheongensis]SHJ60463.1 2-oxo-4-hydroxy-4-carboxy-5-ureidoimidazoline decarboxylase [Hymenobacter daecheongensis DSM 21074]